MEEEYIEENYENENVESSEDIVEESESLDSDSDTLNKDELIDKLLNIIDKELSEEEQEELEEEEQEELEEEVQEELEEEEEENVTVLQEVEKDEDIADNSDYLRYIYFYLRDRFGSDFEQHEELTIMEKPIKDYSVSETLSLSILLFLVAYGLIHFIKENVWRWK